MFVVYTREKILIHIVDIVSSSTDLSTLFCFADTKAFIVYVCSSPLAGAGSQVPFSGHTSFRLLGVFLDPATHTFTFCTCMERYTSLLLLMSLVLTMSTLVYITAFSSQSTKKMFCRRKCDVRYVEHTEEVVIGYTYPCMFLISN